MKVYSAGPAVFSNEAELIFSIQKLLGQKLGISIVTPFDLEAKAQNGHERASEIYKNNIQLIAECDAIIANIEPFRGPSIDPGTAFEIGYAKALGKPVYAYSNDLRDILVKTYKNYNDDLYPIIENFGLTDNLMIACSVDSISESFQLALASCLEKVNNGKR